jgi:hypothetical protein
MLLKDYYTHLREPSGFLISSSLGKEYNKKGFEQKNNLKIRTSG